MNRDRQSGMSLVSVLVATAMLGIIAATMSQLLGDALRTTKKIELDVELAAIRSQILTGIDCESTFAMNGITDANEAASCTSTSADDGQVGPWLRLRRKTKTGTDWMTGTLVGGVATLGRWQIRASCSQGEQSLIIRAARLDAAGNPLTNPLTKKLYSWTAKKSLIFGTGDSSAPICFNAKPTPYMVAQTEIPGTATLVVTPNTPWGWTVVPGETAGTKVESPIQVGGPEEIYEVSGRARFAGSGQAQAVGIGLFDASNNLVKLAHLAISPTSLDVNNGCDPDPLVCRQFFGGGTVTWTGLAAGTYHASLMSFDWFGSDKPYHCLPPTCNPPYHFTGGRGYNYERALSVLRVK